MIDFETPMRVEQMKAFETINDVTINVLGSDKRQLYRVWVSSFDSNLVMDILVFYDDHICIS